MRRSTWAHCYRVIVSSSIIACLLTPTILYAAPRASKDQLVARQSKVNGRIGSLRKVKRALTQKMRQTRARYTQVDAHLQQARGALSAARLTLERQRIELHNAKEALQDAWAELEQSRAAASSHLVSLYQRGEPGYLELLLSSENFGELLQRTDIANYLVEQDHAALLDLKQKKDRLVSYQEQVAAKTQAVASYKTRVEVLTNNVAVQREQVAGEMNEQRRQAQRVDAELAALERESAGVTAMLQALARQNPKLRNVRYAGGPVAGMPCAGRVTSGFGYRIHPILHTRRMHTGVDISAPTGTPIYATGGGQVVYAGWRGGYGNCVIVDHGGGKATLYGHMSQINCRGGQVVSRQTCIGLVGSTGLSTGPHCHYEVRINGTPVNPL